MQTITCATCGAPLRAELTSLEPWWDEDGRGGMRRLGRCPCGAVTAVDGDILPADLPRLVRCGDGRMTTVARLADVVALARAELAVEPQRWSTAASEAGITERTIRAWVEDGASYLTSGSTMAIISWAWAHYGTSADESEVGVEEGAQIAGIAVDRLVSLVSAGAIPSRMLATGCCRLRRADVLALRDRAPD